MLCWCPQCKKKKTKNSLILAFFLTMIAVFSVFQTVFFFLNEEAISLHYLLFSFLTGTFTQSFALLCMLLHSGCVFQRTSLLSDSISSRSFCAGPALCRRGSSISRTRVPSPSECVRKVGLFYRHRINNLTFLSPQSSSWCSVFFHTFSQFFPLVSYLNVIFMQRLSSTVDNR